MVIVNVIVKHKTAGTWYSHAWGDHGPILVNPSEKDGMGMKNGVCDARYLSEL